MKNLGELDRFNLSDHGDRHEREGWKLVGDRFPKYEEFWKLYVVPLTNRTVRASAGPLDHLWIRMRPEVPPEWEKLAVCHYSVFYYLARAAQRRSEGVGLDSDKPIHPEDIIYLLQTCRENVVYFYKALRAVAGGAASDVPLNVPEGFPFREINAYRNLFLHYPVVGRGESDKETLLPRLSESVKNVEQWAEELSFSWRAVERLRLEKLVPARSLLQDIENGLAKYLNHTWTELITHLERCDLHDRFQFLKLPDRMAEIRTPVRIIEVDSSCSTVSQLPAASGTFSRPMISDLGGKKMPR